MQVHENQLVWREPWRVLARHLVHCILTILGTNGGLGLVWLRGGCIWMWVGLGLCRLMLGLGLAAVDGARLADMPEETSATAVPTPWARRAWVSAIVCDLLSSTTSTIGFPTSGETVLGASSVVLHSMSPGAARAPGTLPSGPILSLTVMCSGSCKRDAIKQPTPHLHGAACTLRPCLIFAYNML